MPTLFDAGTVARFQEWLGPGWAGLSEAVSLLGGSWGLLLVFSLGLLAVDRRCLYALLGLALMEGVVRRALSEGLAVPRPEGSGVAHYGPVPPSGSFPSGHVSTAAALWLYLGLVTPTPLAVGLLAGIGVAMARLYLGVHFVADVVAGLLLGAALAWTWARGWPRIADRLSRLPASAGYGLAGLTLLACLPAVLLLPGEDPDVWEGVGLTAGLAVALPVEWRWIRYRPGDARARALTVTTAILPVAALIIWMHRAEPGVHGAALAVGVGTVWSLAGAPALARTLGCTDTKIPRPFASTRHPRGRRWSSLV